MGAVALEQTQIAKQYAKALFEEATAQEQVSLISEELNTLSFFCQDSEDFTLFFTHPGISRQEQLHFIEDRLCPSFSELTARFLRLLAENSRIALMPSVREAYQALWDDSQGQVQVTVSTAVPFPEDLVQRLSEQIQSVFGYQRVSLDCHVNPDLIAGIVLEFDDRRIDGSVLGQLESLKSGLLSKVG